MKEHEAERIAASMHHLRPDWPLKQLLTLLGHPHLADRPRRDVAVALAWVACEPNTSSPYRVLEAGPWWRAAAIEGAPTHRDTLPNHLRCAVCYQPQARCEAARFADDDHEFRPATTDLKRTPDAMAAIVTDAKGRCEQTRETPEPPPVVHDPRAELAREALAGEVAP